MKARLHIVEQAPRRGMHRRQRLVSEYRLQTLLGITHVLGRKGSVAGSVNRGLADVRPRYQVRSQGAPGRIRLLSDLLEIGSRRVELAEVEVGRRNLVLAVVLEHRIVKIDGRRQMELRQRPLLVWRIISVVVSAAAVAEDGILSGDPVAHGRAAHAEGLGAGFRGSGGVEKSVIAAVGIEGETQHFHSLDVVLLRLVQAQRVAARLEPCRLRRVRVVLVRWNDPGVHLLIQALLLLPRQRMLLQVSVGNHQVAPLEPWPENSQLAVVIRLRGKVGRVLADEKRRYVLRAGKDSDREQEQSNQRQAGGEAALALHGCNFRSTISKLFRSQARLLKT